MSEYAPFLEIDPHWEGNDLARPIQTRHELLGTRVFNTHLRFDILPRNGAARWIYLIRSPLDTCVSFYHHLVHQVEGGYEGTFDEFFQEWIAGDIAFGSWVDHVLSFAIGVSTGQQQHVSNSDQVALQLPNGPRILLVSYEEMIHDLPRVVENIQNFLKCNSITSQQRQDMIPTFSFDSMKQNLAKFQPQSVQWKNEFVFLRKGVSGDFHNMISDHQWKQFMEYIEKAKYHEILAELLQESHPHIHRMLEAVFPK